MCPENGYPLCESCMSHVSYVDGDSIFFKGNTMNKFEIGDTVRHKIAGILGTVTCSNNELGNVSVRWETRTYWSDYSHSPSDLVRVCFDLESKADKS